MLEMQGVFCFWCSSITDLDSMFRNPDTCFGSCHKCREPFRSIAMIEVMRKLKDEMKGEFHGSSLVQEGEDDMRRVFKAQDQNCITDTVDEHTHDDSCH
jgi:hypothetical protein